MPNKVITNKNLIDEVLNKGVEKIYPNPDALRKILVSGKRLRVYCGYDPTAPSLHIGHAITLRKLSQFQKLLATLQIKLRPEKDYQEKKC